MKPAIAITLIIAGAALIACPILADFLERSQTASLLRQKEVSSINLHPTMSETYRFGCWFAGISMIGAAILSSRGRSADR